MDIQNLDQASIDTGVARIREHYLERKLATGETLALRLDSYYEALRGFDVAIDGVSSGLLRLRLKSFSMRCALIGGLAS